MKPPVPRRGAWNPAWGLCPKNGKRKFPDRGSARRAIRLMGEGCGGGSIYRCEHCSAYHASSYPKNVARAIAYLLNSLADDRRKALAKKRRTA